LRAGFVDGATRGTRTHPINAATRPDVPRTSPSLAAAGLAPGPARAPAILANRPATLPGIGLLRQTEAGTAP